MANLVIVTRGTKGDLVPLLAIGVSASHRGHRVTVVTHEYYRSIIARSGLEFEALDRAEDFGLFVRDLPLLHSPARIEKFFVKHILPRFELEYQAITRCCYAEKTILLVRHMCGVAPWIVAEQMNLPLIPVYTVVAQVKTLPLLAQLYERKISVYINELRARFKLRAIDNWLDWFHTEPIRIATWPAWFAAPEDDWPPGVNCVGFLLDEIVDSVKPLNDQIGLPRDPILITSGSGVWNFQDEFHAVTARACALLDKPTVLVTQFEHLVPTSLPPNVRWYPYLPFAEIMPCVSLVVHHAGSSVMVRAMVESKPQIVLASGGDRPDTGRRLESLGIAKCHLRPSWNFRQVAKSIDCLLFSTTVREACVRISQRVKEATPGEIACNVIEEALTRA